MTPQRWAVGNDHAGLALKRALVAVLDKLGFEVIDLGAETDASVDYPDFGHAVAKALTSGRADRGLLICGTGIGISIAANRHAGVRAALCTDEFTARMSRMHNDANIVCLGARVTGPGVAEEIVKTFASTEFEGGRHVRRVGKIEI